LDLPDPKSSNCSQAYRCIDAYPIISAIPILKAAAFDEARDFCNEKATYARMRREGGENDPWRNDTEYWYNIISMLDEIERRS
jgi:hypothetical protein